MKKVYNTREVIPFATLLLTAGLTAPLGSVPATAQGATPAQTAAAQGCSVKQIEANKELARLFDMKRDWHVAYQHMSPDYIQHNPIAKRIGDVNGVSGRDEFKLLLELKDKGVGGPPPRLPGQPQDDNYAYIMANCDHVFLMQKIYMPDPQHKGQFYETFDFDLWRVENGKLVEHWDDAKIPENVPPIMTMPVKEMMKSPPPPPNGPKP